MKIDGAHVVVVTPPAVSAVLLSSVKTALRIDHSEEDTLLVDFIRAAADYCEGRLNQALITQTRMLMLPKWGTSGTIDMPYPPLQSVESVEYYDDDVLREWDAANYVVDTAASPGRIWPANSGTYPSHDSRPDAIQITFECGYGDDYTSIPALIRIAIQKIVHDLYEDRSCGLEVKRDAVLDRLLYAASMGHELVA